MLGNPKTSKTDYFNTSNDKSHCIWEFGPYVFHFEKVLGGEDARRKREDELIAEYDPFCNKT